MSKISKDGQGFLVCDNLFILKEGGKIQGHTGTVHFSFAYGKSSGSAKHMYVYTYILYIQYMQMEMKT